MDIEINFKDIKLCGVPISFNIFPLNHYVLEVKLTQNSRGVDGSSFTARVYFRTGFKNNTQDEASIMVKNNKLYSLRSLLALTSFSVDAEPNAKNKPQAAMQTPNGVFIVLMTTQLFTKFITVVSRSSLHQ